MTKIGLHHIDGGLTEFSPLSQAGDAGQSPSIRDGQDCPPHTMAAFSELAARVAHDFNNILTVIAGYSDLLLGLDGLSADGRRSAQEIKRAAGLAFTVTRELVRICPTESAPPTRVALASLVEGMAPVLRRLLGEDIALETVVTGQGPWVMGDPVQLEWMFMNLAAYAKEAMPGGGSFRIEVQRVTRDAQINVRVIVTDTGCGLDAATQAHLFDPVFTSTQPGHVVGLRLATVYEVVTQSHGAIRVASEIGQGTSFTIELPAATEPGEPAEERGLLHAEPYGGETVLLEEAEPVVHTALASWTPKTDLTPSAFVADAGKGEAPMTVETSIRTPHVLTGGPSVLVVDDEPSIRRLMGSLLKDCGYRVRLAADGVEARSTVETEEVSLIICDVHLRGESGLTLVQDLLRQSPQTVALMMSGGGEPESAQGTHEAGIYGHIAKPFNAKDVANRIAQALCGRCLSEDALPRQQRHELTNA